MEDAGVIRSPLDFRPLFVIDDPTRRLSHCFYCGTPEEYLDEFLHKEHYYPKYLGGTDHITNLIPACSDCNYRKGRKHPAEFAEDLYMDFSMALDRMRWLVGADIVNQIEHLVRDAWPNFAENPLDES